MPGPHHDEQEMEIEALKSIYPEEFQEGLSDPTFTFRLHLKAADSSDQDARYVTKCECNVAVEFPLDYPQVVPVYSLEDCEGLDEARQEAFLKFLAEKSNENLGMSMIFSVASLAVEWLTTTHAECIVEYRTEATRKAVEEEEAERVKFTGTLVTPLTFVEWRRKFEAEQAAIKAEKDKAAKLEDKKKRLTGRQLFEQDAGLAKSDAVAEGEEVVEVDESLFEDMPFEEEEEVSNIQISFDD